MGLFNKKNKDNASSSSADKYLKISMTNDGGEYTFLLKGRLDTLTSPDLEAKINDVVDDATKLILDLADLEYISSAGLRVLLGAAQLMEDKGEMVVRNLTSPVSDIFKLTGFSKLFTIIDNCQLFRNCQ